MTQALPRAAVAAAVIGLALTLPCGDALAAQPASPVSPASSAPPAVPAGASDAPLAQLTAEVSLEVTPDELVVSLQAQHAGKDLAAVNQQAAAAAENLQQLLRRHPDLVVRSQRMNTGMDYDQGKPQGWRVRNSTATSAVAPWT